MSKDRLIVLLIVMVLAMGLTACGSGSATAPVGNPTTAPAPTNPAGSAPAAVTVSNFAFDPPSLTVAVGTTVTWTNQDSADHTITSDAGDWDSGRLSQGQSFSHTFDQAGTWPYSCAIHASMKGTIIVTP